MLVQGELTPLHVGKALEIISLSDPGLFLSKRWRTEMKHCFPALQLPQGHRLPPSFLLCLLTCTVWDKKTSANHDQPHHKHSPRTVIVPNYTLLRARLIAFSKR